jgi:gluconolactonase
MPPSMFAVPSEIACEVHALLPVQFRDTEPANDWVRAQPKARAHPVLEGPSVDLGGNLWCVDIPGGRIFRIAPGGNFELMAQYDGWPNGLKIHRDGRIFIADQKHGIMVLDPDTRTVRPWLERAGIERFKGVNDLFFARNGDLYFTDQGLTGLHDPTGRVFRVTAAGAITCLVDNVPSPNGLVMNLDENVLYVAATRANAVWALPFTRDGRVTKVATFLQLSGGGGPDGLALDAKGRLAVAHVGLGSVWVFDRYGEPVHRVRSPGGRLTTNVAFGGDDGKTLFITEGEQGAVLRARLDVPGKPMFSHQAQPQPDALSATH